MMVWVPFSSSGMDSTWGQALAKGMLSQEGHDGVECITTVDPRETHELLATTSGLGHVVLVCENADNTIGSKTQGDAHQIGHVAGRHALGLLKRVLGLPRLDRPAVWIVTRGVHTGLPPSPSTSITAMQTASMAGVWGLARSARAEAGAGLRCVCVDVESVMPAQEARKAVGRWPFYQPRDHTVSSGLSEGDPV